MTMTTMILNWLLEVFFISMWLLLIALVVGSVILLAMPGWMLAGKKAKEVKR